MRQVNTSTVDETVRAARELIRRGRLQEAAGLLGTPAGSRARVSPRAWSRARSRRRAPISPKALEIISTSLERARRSTRHLLLKRAQILMEPAPAEPRPLPPPTGGRDRRADPRLLQTVAHRCTCVPTIPGAPSRCCTGRSSRRRRSGAALQRGAQPFLPQRDGRGRGAARARADDAPRATATRCTSRSQLSTQTRDANHIAELRAVLARPRVRERGRNDGLLCAGEGTGGRRRVCASRSTHCCRQTGSSVARSTTT